MKLVTLHFTVDGIEKTYDCGRHEIPKEVAYHSVFMNVEILGVTDHEGNAVEWQVPAKVANFAEVAA